LNSYPDCWVDFVNNEVSGPGKIYRIPFTNLQEIKESLSYQGYKNLKIKYRESEFKANLEPTPDAKPALDALKEKGYRIVVMTARPVEDHPSLYKTTPEWFTKKDIPYDAIIYSRKKQVQAMVEFPTAKFIVEDNRKTANLLAKFGFKVYLKNNKYNQGELLLGVKRIDSLLEIEEVSND